MARRPMKAVRRRRKPAVYKFTDLEEAYITGYFDGFLRRGKLGNIANTRDIKDVLKELDRDREERLTGKKVKRWVARWN